MLTTKKALSCAWAILCAALLLTIALPQQAAADGDDPPGRVARLSYLRGAVSFQPAGESDWVTASLNRPMTTGDKLWADSDSRAELHIGSAAISLNSNTGFSFLNLDDRTVQIQLSAGTLSIRVRRLERDEIFEVDTPNQSFSILRPGHYRLDASEDGNSTIVTVKDGKGEASGADRTYTIESRERASLNGTDTLSADIDKLDRRDRDDFDDWCEEREHREVRSRSVRYVSPEMVGYEDLDENGIWRHDPEYGEVWVPTAVPVGWAPYHYGHWAWIAPWGWTWVDDAPWGYAPFHYGRWAYARGSWCWVPGPVEAAPVYAPALVAFVGGPNFAIGIAVGGGAAVGWFPLGPREVYVPAYRTSPDYVTRVNVSNTNVSRTTVTNVYNTTVVNNTTVVSNVTYVNRTAPGAVTAVSATAFTSAQPVASSAVKVNQNQLASAPIVTRASVAPTQNSILGPSEHAPGRLMPPGLANRAVVAKTPPPPPPVSFERQRETLAAHPGQPLAHNEVETLRPANVQHPLVRQVSPNQPGNLNRGEGRVAGAPQPPNRQQENPNTPANGALNRPANNPSAGVPPRRDGAEPDRPDNRPAASQAPNVQPSYRPGNAQPPYARTNDQPQKQNRPEQPVSAPSQGPSNNPASNDRPANAQPSYRPSPESRPNPGQAYGQRPLINGQPENRSTPPQSSDRPANTQPIYRPLSPENRSNSAPPSNERRPEFNSQPSNRPTPPQSNDRPSNTQPNYQPPPPSARPNPAPSERPTTFSQPQNAPSVQPSNRRIEPPSNPLVSRPTNPPAPENRNAAPKPQPSGVSAVPESKGRPSNPAPAQSNKSSSGNKKENEKRN
jgi:uncharacterized protein DUF6600